MSLMDDLNEIRILQDNVAEKTYCKCICALMQHEKLDFHTAVEKLNFPPAKIERLKKLLTPSNQHPVNAYYTRNFKQLLGKLEAEYNRQTYFWESLQKQLTSFRITDEVQRLQAEIADLMNRSLLILSPKEKEDLDVFRRQHWERCEVHSLHFEIDGCGFSRCVSVTCPICGATADITDIDSW